MYISQNPGQTFGPTRSNAGAPRDGTMSAMMSMMAQVMSMMQQVIGAMIGGQGGNLPMPSAPGGFGATPAMCGCGSPLGGFLGNGGGMVDPRGFGSGPTGGEALGWNGSGGPGGPTCTPPSGNDGSPPNPLGPVGPAGDIGNVDVGRLVAALPPSRRKAAEQNFPYILAEAKQQGVTNKAQLAYILATATHESGAGAHMEEFASGRAYEGRSDLGNSQSGDGVRYKGRGYVQLTGRRNYQDWSNRLGMDLVGNPDIVKDPRVAAKILVGGMMEGTFTGKGLGSYVNDEKTDFVGARKTVNGTDRAGEIAGIAQRLQQAMV